MLQEAKMRSKNICTEKPFFSLISRFLTPYLYEYFAEFRLRDDIP